MREPEPIVDLSERRRLKHEANLRPEMAAELIELATIVANAEGDDLPRAAFLVSLHEDGPHLNVLGRPTRDDLRYAGWALDDALLASATQDESLQMAVRIGWEKRLELAAAMSEQESHEEEAREQGLLSD